MAQVGPASTISPTISVENVTFAYARHPVLESVSFTVDPGELFGILGPNGSGKTTLLKLLAGLLRPNHGRVMMNETDLALLAGRDIARRIAFVGQDETTDFNFSVREEVMLGRFPHHGGLYFENREDHSTVDEILAVTELEDLASRSVHEISGGERQRVRLARALAQRPEVLLLDEPTNHLDPYSLLGLKELLSDVRCNGVTIVVVSHNIDFIAESATRCVLLAGRSMAFQGTTEDAITPDNLRNCFRIEASVDRNPATGSPGVTPIRRM